MDCLYVLYFFIFALIELKRNRGCDNVYKNDCIRVIRFVRIRVTDVSSEHISLRNTFPIVNNGKRNVCGRNILLIRNCATETPDVTYSPSICHFAQ